MGFLLFLYVMSMWACGAQAEVFTAMSDVSRLLKTEGEMIRTIENYISAQEERLGKLKRDLAEMEKIHDEAAQSPEVFLSSPINAYLLVKRLTIDWADLQTVLTDDSVGRAMLNNLTGMAGMLRWPDEEDLNGAAAALMRLQDTYQLDTSQLASGLIKGRRMAYRELTASDCFELGRQSYNNGDHYHTILWMNEALLRHELEGNHSLLRSDILEYLAFSTFMEGNIAQALKLTNELLTEKPDHKRAQGNKVYYEEHLTDMSVRKRGEDEGITLEDFAVKKGYTVHEKGRELEDWEKEKVAYETLCRGEALSDPQKEVELYCEYRYGPGKLLQLARVATEVVHLNPTVVLFHNILYDSEIDAIKQLAMPKFTRATVQNYKTGELETASYRISKSAWLKEEESEVIPGINKRIESLTGLNLATAEELQVANYGLGGHYEPHFDFARREEKDAFKSLGTGNRIATFLFYMSDLEAGGATVFPHLSLALWPQKGTAAFWHNLHPSGEGDLLTRHAACPVLIGQKWVSNKWLHERGQEFRRPCTLNFSDP